LKHIAAEVITETGELLGRVRNFKFNRENGKVYSLIIASLGIPQIPEQVLSTYELPIEEIVSSGPNRLIVLREQKRVTQLMGWAPGLSDFWERGRRISFSTTTRAENQLGTGVPL